MIRVVEKSQPTTSGIEMNHLTPSPDITDVATVEQQIELHAMNIERIHRDAVYEMGREFTAAQELHRYKGGDEGFTKWLARRFPAVAQSSAYQMMEIFRGVSEELFPKFGNMKPSAIAEIAKAEPDIQAIVADRVAAGEVFTAAQVKEIKAAAAQEAIEKINTDAEEARAELKTLKKAIEAKDIKSADEVHTLELKVKELETTVKGFEKQAEDHRKSLLKPEKAKAKAAETGGVVLGSDGKYHSGSSAEQKKMHDAFMFAFDRLLDLTEDAPSPTRVAAGCPKEDRARTVERCDQAVSYLNTIKDAINGQ